MVFHQLADFFTEIYRLLVEIIRLKLTRLGIELDNAS
jgi:hypothetical protein